MPLGSEGLDALRAIGSVYNFKERSAMRNNSGHRDVQEDIVLKRGGLHFLRGPAVGPAR